MRRSSNGHQGGGGSRLLTLAAAVMIALSVLSWQPREAKALFDPATVSLLAASVAHFAASAAQWVKEALHWIDEKNDRTKQVSINLAGMMGQNEVQTKLAQATRNDEWQQKQTQTNSDKIENFDAIAREACMTTVANNSRNSMRGFVSGMVTTMSSNMADRGTGDGLAYAVNLDKYRCAGGQPCPAGSRPDGTPPTIDVMNPGLPLDLPSATSIREATGTTDAERRYIDWYNDMLIAAGPRRVDAPSRAERATPEGKILGIEYDRVVKKERGYLDQISGVMATRIRPCSVSANAKNGAAKADAQLRCTASIKYCALAKADNLDLAQSTDFKDCDSKGLSLMQLRELEVERCAAEGRFRGKMQSGYGHTVIQLRDECAKQADELDALMREQAHIINEAKEGLEKLQPVWEDVKKHSPNRIAPN